MPAQSVFISLNAPYPKQREIFASRILAYVVRIGNIDSDAIKNKVVTSGIKFCRMSWRISSSNLFTNNTNNTLYDSCLDCSSQDDSKRYVMNGVDKVQNNQEFGVC